MEPLSTLKTEFTLALFLPMLTDTLEIVFVFVISPTLLLMPPALYNDGHLSFTCIVRNVREGVASHRCQEEGVTVGRPTEKEAREALVDCRGVKNRAIAKIFDQRKKMVRLLCARGRWFEDRKCIYVEFFL